LIEREKKYVLPSGEKAALKSSESLETMPGKKDKAAEAGCGAG
jgi:hypothetical protein